MRDNDNNQESQYKFVPDVWVCGIYQAKEIIGRTILVQTHNSPNIKIEHETVAFVSDDGRLGVINFSEIKEPRILKTSFTKMQDDLLDLLMNKK